jgi:hypothetical protein
MNIGPITHRCGVCGEQWWDAHCCPKQTPPMTVARFFDEAKRLNLRMLDTPAETRAGLDLKDAEIEKLKALARRSATQLRKWSEWYGSADHAARGQLPLPPAGDVELSEDISAALGPNVNSATPAVG